MTDIFNEVDEEVRREKLKQFWERYNAAIIGVALLIVIGVGGWRAWQWYDQKKAAEAGAAFETAVSLDASGKTAEAQAAFERIAATGTSGYRLLARIREATELAQKDRTAAVAAYDSVAKDSGVERTFQDLAAIRAALLLLDSAPLSDIQQRLEPLSANDRPFRHTAREIMALSAWRAGDKAAARRWANLILTDPDTPAASRARVEVIGTLLGESRKG